MERRDLDSFIHQLGIFVWIAGALLILNVGQAFLNQMIRLKLRQGLTMDLLGEWMQPRRAFRLASAGPIGANPDQRIHEDARHLVDLTTDLGVGLLQSSILLASFVGVLWSLSADFVITISRPSHRNSRLHGLGGVHLCRHGLVHKLDGRALAVVLNGDKYAREAELRFSLMHANEHLDAISLAGGEADERRRIEFDLALCCRQRDIIIRAVTIRLNWVTAGYGWVTVVAPIIIAAPVYFSGDLTFGGLMMAVGAFNQVHASLRWFINNIGGIADWRATLLRVADFRSAVKMTDVLHDVEKAHRDGQGRRRQSGSSRRSRSPRRGQHQAVRSHGRDRTGDHVLMNGDPARHDAAVSRHAGLWPWGSGQGILPAGEPVTFLPRTPYFPPGSLREVLCYPRRRAH